MGLKEELAKVRLARSKLEITRAKLEKLDEDQRQLETRMRAKPDQSGIAPPRKGRRRGFDIS